MKELTLFLKHISPSFLSSREHNYPLLHCYSHCYYTQFNNVFPLQQPRRNSIHKTHFQLQATPTKTRDRNKCGNRKLISSEEQLMYGNGGTESEEEDEVEGAYNNLATRTRMNSLLAEEGDTEDEESSSTLLSLSEKPDRNTALLDDYEIEELDFVNDDDPSHRSGYVAVLGKPNVGKSTLSNQMIGQKLSIVTDKPQTTRHRILGICSGQDYQMILYDTPGVIEKKMHKLDSMMMNNVRSAAVNADCVLVVVDACKAPQKIDEVLEEGIGELKDKLPILLVLNKKDLIKPGEIAKKLEWYEKFTDADEVMPVSAKYGHGVDDVKDWILSKLPSGPAYYPKDIASEHPE